MDAWLPGIVVASGLGTVAAAVITKRAVVARRYVPKYFEANHIPPDFSFTRDALHAIGDATLLAGGAFTFAASSTLWIMDVKSMKDFGLRMRQKLQPLGLQAPAETATDENDEAISSALKKWVGK